MRSTQGANLSRDAALCPTPSAGAHNEHESPESFAARAERLKEKGYNGNGASKPLGIAAKEWATPTAHDRTHAPRAVDHGEQLANQATAFLPPGLPDRATAQGGSSGSSSAVLNPSFVEALMGFPPSWTVPTACARSETPSSPRKPLERSSSSLGGP